MLPGQPDKRDLLLLLLLCLLLLLLLCACMASLWRLPVPQATFRNMLDTASTSACGNILLLLLLLSVPMALVLLTLWCKMGQVESWC